MVTIKTTEEVDTTKPVSEDVRKAIIREKAQMRICDLVEHVQNGEGRKELVEMLRLNSDEQVNSMAEILHQTLHSPIPETVTREFIADVIFTHISKELAKEEVRMKSRITVEGTPAEMPDGLSLKAQMGWEYYFGQEGRVCFSFSDGTINDGPWLVLGKNRDLNTAEVYIDDDAFFDFLKMNVDEKLEEEGAQKFFSRFVTVPDLVTEEVAQAMRHVID